VKTTYFQREGWFRARPVAWHAKQIPTGSVAICVGFEVVADLHGTRIDGRQRVQGDFFVTKSTGAPNQKVAQLLCDCAGWGGTFAELSEVPPLDAEIEVEVEAREHKGKLYYQAKWMRPIGGDSEGGGGSVDLAKLDAKHGAEIRKAIKLPKRDPQPDGIPF
jgi:hypothetical protein